MDDKKDNNYGIDPNGIMSDPQGAIMSGALIGSNLDVINITPPGLFQNNAEYSQEINQIGYVLVEYDFAHRVDVLSRIESIKRRGDDITIIRPGHLMMLIHNVKSIESIRTIIEKIRSEFSDHKCVSTVGLFVPYPTSPLNTVYKKLTALLDMKEGSAILKTNCENCAHERIIIRPEDFVGLHKDNVDQNNACDRDD